MSVKSTIVDWLGLNGLDEIVTYINKTINGTAKYTKYGSDEQKLKVVLSNPAVLKVFALQCELFSLGKIYVYKDGKAIEDDPFLDMIKKPNPFQTQQQLLWDYMFWLMIGNAYTYVEGTTAEKGNRLYVLKNSNITFTPEFDKYRDKLILSDKTVKDINDLTFNYSQNDGGNKPIKWGNVIHVPDVSNGVSGNWFRGDSRLDALYKVVNNSEAALDAKNINVRYSGKFMVAGTSDPDNVHEQPLSEDEKRDIETKMNGRKSVHAVKSMIDIKRFVENIANLRLDESYWADYFIIGAMYNIPQDVLEWYLKGSTFENQEKARGAHVSYCLQPKGDIWFQGFESYFGYDEEGKSLVIDWEHLPFMQVFAKERAETRNIDSETLTKLIDAGLSLEDINRFMDAEFKSVRKPQQTTNTQDNGNK